MKNRPIALAALAVLCLAGRASAQEGSAFASLPKPVANDTAVHVAQPSVIDRPSDAVRRTAAAREAPLPGGSQSLGAAKAQMAVGGAAIVVGALIGGDGGAVLMFGGAIVGLYGLWNYLR